MDPANQRFYSSYGTHAEGWGMWLTFFQNVPPQVEFFATANDAAEEGWFDMVYLGPQTTPGI